MLQVLEERRVPVDFVVGTSMGSILGGLYSIGYSPDEMEKIISEADWTRILSDEPYRENLWIRRRQDQRRFRIDLEFGWSDGSPTLPPGLGDITVMAFDRSLDAIRLGYASADTEVTREWLSKLSIAEAKWNEWLAHQRKSARARDCSPSCFSRSISISSWARSTSGSEWRKVVKPLSTS